MTAGCRRRIATAGLVDFNSDKCLGCYNSSGARDRSEGRLLARRGPALVGRKRAAIARLGEASTHSAAWSASAFSDLIALRTLVKLYESRIPPARIRNVLSAVRARLQDINDPLKQLRLISDGKRIHVQIGDHSMEPISGQLLFNFDQAELGAGVVSGSQEDGGKPRDVGNQRRSGSRVVWNPSRRAQFRRRSRRTKALLRLTLRRLEHG